MIYTPTGNVMIDAMSPITREQMIPIYTASDELADQSHAQPNPPRWTQRQLLAPVSEPIGCQPRNTHFLRFEFKENGSLDCVILANDPKLERILSPSRTLTWTAADYYAHRLEKDASLLLGGTSTYVDALRGVVAAHEVVGLTWISSQVPESNMPMNEPDESKVGMGPPFRSYSKSCMLMR